MLLLLLSPLQTSLLWRGGDNESACAPASRPWHLRGCVSAEEHTARLMQGPSTSRRERTKARNARWRAGFTGDVDAQPLCADSRPGAEQPACMNAQPIRGCRTERAQMHVLNRKRTLDRREQRKRRLQDLLRHEAALYCIVDLIAGLQLQRPDSAMPEWEEHMERKSGHDSTEQSWTASNSHDNQSSSTMMITVLVNNAVTVVD